MLCIIPDKAVTKAELTQHIGANPNKVSSQHAYWTAAETCTMIHPAALREGMLLSKNKSAMTFATEMTTACEGGGPGQAKTACWAEGNGCETGSP